MYDCAIILESDEHRFAATGEVRRAAASVIAAADPLALALSVADQLGDARRVVTVGAPFATNALLSGALAAGIDLSTLSVAHVGGAGADAFTESAGAPSDPDARWRRLREGRGASVSTPTLRLDGGLLPLPVIGLTAAFGEVAPVLARAHRDAGAIELARSVRGALDGAWKSEAEAWVASLDGAACGEGAWGIIVTASGALGIGGRVQLSADTGRLGVAVVDPGDAGGLLGIVRGLAGLLAGSQRRAGQVLLVDGVTACACDGWDLGESWPTSFRVSMGPSVTLLA